MLGGPRSEVVEAAGVTQILGNESLERLHRDGAEEGVEAARQGGRAPTGFPGAIAQGQEPKTVSRIQPLIGRVGDHLDDRAGALA